MQKVSTKALTNLVHSRRSNKHTLEGKKPSYILLFLSLVLNFADPEFEYSIIKSHDIDELHSGIIKTSPFSKCGEGKTNAVLW